MRICEPGTPTTRQHFASPEENFRGKDPRRGKGQVRTSRAAGARSRRKLYASAAGASPQAAYSGEATALNPLYRKGKRAFGV
jgi:hypothetical protein